MTTRQILTIAVDDGCDIPTEQVAELVHQLVPGSHTLDNVTVDADLTDFEWDEHDEHPSLPMGPVDARRLMNDDGDITVVLSIDQDTFLGHHGLNPLGGDTRDHLDLLHDATFTFGLSHGSDATILAVSGGDLVISYTTNISAVLDDSEIEDDLHSRADEFVSGLDDSERVDWLHNRGLDLEHLRNLDTETLDETCRDVAHEISSEAANGSQTTPPSWLT